MAKGTDMRLFLPNAATDNFIELIGQGDGTYNPGREAQTTRTKNSQQGFINKTGATMTCTVEVANPMDASQTQLFAIAAAEAPVRVKYESVVAGGLAYHGNALVVVGELSDPVDGVQTAQVSVAWDEIPTEAVSPVAF